MSAFRTTVPLALAVTLIAAGCGSEDEEQTAEEGARPAPAVSDFPAVEGQTLEEIYSANTPSEDVVVSPAGQTFTRGENRFGFGVFTLAQEQVTDAEVAVYVSDDPDAAAEGPYPARIETLETEPEFTADTTADDPDAAQVVYVTEIPFDREGEWRMVALVRRGDITTSTRIPSAVVGPYADIPEVGEAAPRVHTPTAETESALDAIDTRVPHDTMHDVDAAGAIGKEPTVLLFATPALCVSRVCGPVVDVAEQVKSEVGESGTFIHMEVYEENDPEKGIRPQLRAYGLETEPWLFVLDSDGRVSTRIEGAFSVAELRDALEKAS